MDMKRTGRLASLLLILAGCESNDLKDKVIARQITSRRDLIGGPSALGDVGDYLLANEKIRVIIQGPGYSRGFGIYGGSLIDADLQRPRSAGDSAGGKGYDAFSELFPAIFLKAMKPRADGMRAAQSEDGSGAATVVVSGSGDEFLYISKTVDDVLIPSSEKLVFQNEYKLSPGKRYVEITTTVINLSETEIPLPGPGLPLNGLRLPLGDVILFGAANHVFSEQAGFDLRFTLEKLYENAPGLPKLPGIVAPFLASKGEHVSYGFMSGITDPDLSFVKSAGYEGADAGDILVPFLASSFTGAFYGAAPRLLKARSEGPKASSFAFKKYFIVGSGDVASIRDVFHEIRNITTGTFAGIVRDERSIVAQAGVSVVTFDSKGSPYSQHTTDAEGSFRGTYAPGEYTYRVVADGRFTTPAAAFSVTSGQSTFADIRLPPPGLVAVRIRSEDGKLMPARCNLVGEFPQASLGFDPKDFLYSFKFGEAQRATTCPTCEGSDPSKHEFIEQTIIASTGIKTEPVRPGKYRAVCSRGMEYDIVEKNLDVRSSELAQIDVVLKRVIDTRGWVSGDYHMHSINSVDSSIGLEQRIGHAAAEGLDIACATDHNYVTDYTPAIQRLGIEPWIQGIVGLELTTLEIGHFNGFPLRYNPGPITKGTFEPTQKADLLGNPLRWQGQPPANLMRDLRSLGSRGAENTIVQVNHPRDTILGYFNDYHLNADTAEVEPLTDSFLFLEPKGPEFIYDAEGNFIKERFAKDFDAIEVFNGKRFDMLHTHHLPAVLPPMHPDVTIPPDCVRDGVSACSVLRDSNGKVAFPGAMEDWFAFLNKGAIYTATGNSDTHSEGEEPGIPRTYTPVSGSDRPGAIDELEVVDALKNQRAIATNGPFITVQATGSGNCHERRIANGAQAGRDLGRADCGMGEVVTAAGGQVTVRAVIQVAPWISIDTVNLIRGGEIVKTIRGDRTSLASINETIPAARDTWLVVEVAGHESMWPVIAPLEIPAVQISDAVKSIGKGIPALANAFKDFGVLGPSRTYVNRAEGFTNPIFIDADGDGRYTAPGVSQHGLRSANDLSKTSKASIRKFEAGELPVLVRMFGAFAAHAH